MTNGLPPSVSRVLLLQTGVTAVVVVFAYIVSGWIAAYSAMLGGIICIVPTVYAAWRVYLPGLKANGDRVLATMYRAVIGKFVMTGVLFAMVFIAVKPLNAAALFATFTAAAIISWIGGAAHALSGTHMRDGV